MDAKKHIKTILGELFNKTIDDDFAQENEDDWDSFAHLDLVSNLINPRRNRQHDIFVCNRSYHQ